MEKDCWLLDESRHIPSLGGTASTLRAAGQNSQENVPRNAFRKLSVLQCIMEVLFVSVDGIAVPNVTLRVSCPNISKHNQFCLCPPAIIFLGILLRGKIVSSKWTRSLLRRIECNDTPIGSLTMIQGI